MQNNDDNNNNNNNNNNYHNNNNKNNHNDNENKTYDIIRKNIMCATVHTCLLSFPVSRLQLFVLRPWQ